MGGNIRSAIDNQLTCSLNTARAAHSRHLRQSLHGVLDPIIDQDRCPRTIRFDVIENCNAISESKNRPFKVHVLAISLLSCGCTPLRKMRFHFFMGYWWTRIV